MQYLWTGEWPVYRAPSVFGLTVNGLNAADSVRVTAAAVCQATVAIKPSDNQLLTYRWEIMAEVDKSVESDGGDFEPTPDIIWRGPLDSSNAEIEFTAPSPGEYRLFVYADDIYGSAATANIPILVEPDSFMGSIRYRVKKYFPFIS